MAGGFETLVEGGLAGGAFGQVVHGLSLRKAKKNRNTLLSTHGNIPAPEHPHGGIWRMFSHMMGIGAVAGIAITSSIAPGAEISTTSSQGRIIAIDNLDFGFGLKPDKGQVSLSTQDQAAELQNSVADSLLAKERTIHLDAVSDGTIMPVTSQAELAHIFPYGPSNTIVAAVSNDLATGFSMTSSGGRSEANGGALIILDDNKSIGFAKGVEQAAGQAGHIPIYIANVVTGSPNTNTAALEAIAHATHGHYWNLTPTDVNSVAAAIESRVNVEGPSNPGGNPDQALWLSIAGLSLAALGVSAARLAKEGAIT